MRSGRSNVPKIVFWGSSLPVLLAASFLYYPYVFSGPVLCPLPLTLGIPCPGCGLTRATSLLTHGHFMESLAFYPLLPPLLLYAAFLCAYKIIEHVRGTPPALPTYKISGVAIWVMMGFWVVRLGFFFAEGGLETMAHDNLVSRLMRLFS